MSECKHEFVYVLVEDVNNVPASTKDGRLDMDEANAVPLDRIVLEIECISCDAILDKKDYDTTN